MNDIDEQVVYLKDFLLTALAGYDDRNVNAQALLELSIEMCSDGFMDRAREAFDVLCGKGD